MSASSDFADHRPSGGGSRIDENFVRILFVEDRRDVADEIHGLLGCSDRGSFEVIRETNLFKAAAKIEGNTFDLLLLDLSLLNIERTAAVQLANDLAHRLPVVVLTGTEELDEPSPTTCKNLKHCMGHADVPGKLLAAIRRSRRFGTGVTTPLFCRIEGLCG